MWSVMQTVVSQQCTIRNSVGDPLEGLLAVRMEKSVLCVLLGPTNLRVSSL